MPYRIKKRIQGSISVLLIIILVPILVLSGVIVDTSRLNMAKSMVSSAGDLALNSALADYDTILKDVYGLFAMSQNKSDADLQTEIQKYFENTLVSYGVVNEAEAGNYVQKLLGNFSGLMTGTGGLDIGNFMDMTVDNSAFTVAKQKDSGLNNPQVLRRQIVDYMKFRGPINFGLSFFDTLKAFTSVEDQSKVVEAQVKAQEKIQDVTEGCKETIAAFREYDKMIVAMNGGDAMTGVTPVKGLDNSKDGVVVPILQYDDQVNKYDLKTTWGDDAYEEISRLVLIFLLKTPESKDMYLSKRSFDANQLYIIFKNIDGINYTVIDDTDCGITVTEPTYPESIADMKTMYENQATALNNTSGDLYQKQTTYKNNNYLDRLLINTEKTGFASGKMEEMIDSYIKYEKFVADVSDNVGATPTMIYNDIKPVLENLELYHKYYTKYDTMLQTKISELNGKISTAKTEMDNAKKAMDNAETKANEEQAKFNAVATTAAAATQATIDLATALSNWNTATTAFNACTAPPSSTTYKNLKKAMDNAKTAYDNAVQTEKDAIKAAEDAAAAAPSVEELAGYWADFTAKGLEYDDPINKTGKKNIYDALVHEKELVQSDKNVALSNYSATLTNYKEFASAYQHDLELYPQFKTAATTEIDTRVANVNAQIKAIESNLTQITGALAGLGTSLSNLRGLIETYQTELGNWETANNTYKANKGDDSFSKQSASDVAGQKDQYNLESLDTLKTYVGAISDEYNDFYDYLEKDDTYKYGAKKIQDLTTGQQVCDAIPQTVRDSMPQKVISKEDAVGKFSELYVENNASPDTLEVDPETFVKPNVTPIQFLVYLNENFPETAKTVTDDVTNSSDPNADYEKMRDDMGSDKSGEDKLKDDAVSGFGYTYTSRTVPDDVPSKGEAAKKKDGKAESAKISKDGDKVKAGEALENQNKGIGDVLKGIGDVMKAGMENIYIVNYIFENFSYNTLVQDEIVKGLKYETYAQAMGLSSNAKKGDYLGKATTLSNYNINSTNNWLYGGEIEYVLWGNKNASTNVKYTKASIYALRFAFNCIFAFTDNTIRNITRAAGLAVQAATMGFVPYQIVQIVLQLAMAAGESAIDLDMMNNGLKVAVVKTDDTWTLSIKGGLNLAKDAAAAVTDNMIQKAGEVFTNCVNKIVDATAENLEDAAGNITDTLSSAAKDKIEEVIEVITTEVQSKLDGVFAEIQKVAVKADDGVVKTRDTIKGEIAGKFDAIMGSVNTYIDGFASNPVAGTLIPSIKSRITGEGGVITTLRDKATGYVDEAFDTGVTGEQLASKIYEKVVGNVTQLKMTTISKLSGVVDDLQDSIDSKTKELISSTTEKIEGKVEEFVKEKGEEAAKTARDAIVKELDNFSNTYLKDMDGVGSNLTDKVGDGASTKTSSGLASMIKFGYKDYLMLFTFIYTCASSNTVLKRTGDLIQMNMQHATGAPGTGEDGQLCFKHKKGEEFQLKDAMTYVRVGGKVKTDMMFMKMDFFNNLVLNDGEDFDTVYGAGSTIVYNGFGGY